MKITAATMVVIWVFNRVVDRIWPVPQVLRDKNKEWWWSYVITGQIFTCVAGCGSLYWYASIVCMLCPLLKRIRTSSNIRRCYNEVNDVACSMLDNVAIPWALV